MLTPEAFRAWCEHLHFAPETEALIASIRESPPVHKVRGRANNVTERYPSPKMDCSIHYDQSARIPLHYRAKSGRNTIQCHTPDFFVIRRERAGWEEWKPASALDTLFDTMPARYQQDTTEHLAVPTR